MQVNYNRPKINWTIADQRSALLSAIFSSLQAARTCMATCRFTIYSPADNKGKESFHTIFQGANPWSDIRSSRRHTGWVEFTNTFAIQALLNAIGLDFFDIFNYVEFPTKDNPTIVDLATIVNKLHPICSENAIKIPVYFLRQDESELVIMAS